MERSLTILRWSAGLAATLATVSLITLSLSHSGYLGGAVRLSIIQRSA